MKSSEITNSLKEKFVGTEYSSLSWDGYRYFHAVKESLDPSIAKDVSYHRSNSGSRLELTYKNHMLCGITVRKEKNRHKKDWRDGNWKVKDVSAHVYSYGTGGSYLDDIDIFDAIAGINKLVEKETAAKNEKLVRAAKAVKKIMDEYGLSYYDAITVMEVAKENKYSSAFASLVKEAE